jgi:PAS domain-containing protein
VPSLILRLEPLQPPPVVVDVDEPADSSTPLGRWSAAVAAAQDACLVLDPDGRVVSLSATAAELLDCSDDGVIGRRFADIAALIDFETGETDPDYVSRIPPLAVLSGGGMGRSLIRVRHSDDAPVTLDVCAMALHDAAGRVVGSLSWFATLPL